MANVAGIIAAAAAVIAVALAVVNMLSPAQAHVTKRAPQIEPVSLQMPEPGPGEKSEVQIILHNVGNERSIIKRAVVRILHSDQMHLCFSQGSLGLSESYDVTLPDSPAPGQIVEVPLHEQLASDEADRFALSFRPEPPTTAEATTQGPTIYLYQLELLLLHDVSNTPVRLGKVLLALPMAPEPEEFYWASKLESPSVRASGLSTWGAGYYAKLMPCWRSNSLVLRQFLALAGERSPGLVNMASKVIVPSPQLVQREETSCKRGLAQRKQRAREAEEASFSEESNEAGSSRYQHPFELVC